PRRPTLRTRPGRTSRARSHGPWSPRARYRGRTRLLQFAGVCVAGVMVAAIGVGAYANSLIADLPPIQAYAKEAATLHGDTLVYDRNGKLLADDGVGDGSYPRRDDTRYKDA